MWLDVCSINDYETSTSTKTARLRGCIAIIDVGRRADMIRIISCVNELSIVGGFNACVEMLSYTQRIEADVVIFGL